MEPSIWGECQYQKTVRGRFLRTESMSKASNLYMRASQMTYSMCQGSSVCHLDPSIRP